MDTKRLNTKRIALDAHGMARMQEMADYHGITLRQLFEALMHYAISTYERPHSWEADRPFHPSNYGPDSYADKWF